jgi:sigma-54 specific flagellar transcriptional regulator A
MGFLVDPLPPGGVDLDAALSVAEQRLINEALDRCGGNVAAAARLLTLKRTTLVMRLRRMREAA